MKRLLALLLACLLPCLSAVAEVIHSPEYNQGFYDFTGIAAQDAVVLCESLTVRTLPAADAPASDTLRYGDRFVTSESRDGWLHIYYADASREGWVRGEYALVCPSVLQLEEPAPAYAYGSRYAPRVALLDKGTELPIITTTAAYYVVSLRGASAWVERPAARETAEFDLAQLSGLTGARLMYRDAQTGGEYDLSLTDAASLGQLAALLADAEDQGAATAGCPFSNARLTLALPGGEQTLLLATDDCCVFRVNGRDYKYARSLFDPEKGSPTNDCLFGLFPGLPERP